MALELIIDMLNSFIVIYLNIYLIIFPYILTISTLAFFFGLCVVTIKVVTE